MLGYSKDPVCGMQVNIEQTDFDKMTCEYEGEKYHFCSSRCKEQFEENPVLFIQPKQKSAKA